MFNFFKPKSKPRTMLDSVQEVSERLIVKGYRKIAAQHGCAPTAKTTDNKIIEIYTQVGTAFHQAAERRGEHIPALYQNRIVLQFFQAYEMFLGKHEQFFHDHLQYEVNKYLVEGLRPDYKQELPLFDPEGNDPDVRRLSELQNKAMFGSESGLGRCVKNAEAGDAKAQFHLGGFYERGQLGLQQNYIMAAKWYRKAAEQGHAGAQLYLGIFLAQGKGLAQDVVEAYKWINLAKGGNMLDKAAAIETQNKLIPFMTPEQIADGQRLAIMFVPTKK